MAEIDVDYADVDPPDPHEKPRNDWGWAARRAELLELLFEAGSPRLLNQKELASRYDVHPSTICRDFDRLAEYVEATIGDRMKARCKTLYEAAVSDALADGDTKEAFELHLKFLDVLLRLGEIQEAPSRVDADVTHRKEMNETADYVVIPDDGVEIDDSDMDTQYQVDDELI